MPRARVAPDVKTPRLTKKPISEKWGNSRPSKTPLPPVDDDVDSNDSYKQRMKDVAEEAGDLPGGGGGNYSKDHSHEDEDDDEMIREDGDSLDGAGTGTSGTSSSAGSADTRELLNKNTPLGLGLLFWMAVMFAIPVILIIVFLALPLSAAVAADNVFNHHRDEIVQIITTSSMLEEERNETSLYLESIANTTHENKTWHELLHARHIVDDELLLLTKSLRTSTIERAEELRLKFEEVSRNIVSLREKVKYRLVTGPEARSSYLYLADDVQTFMLDIAKDPDAHLFEIDLTLLYMIKRIENAFSMMGTIGAAFLYRDGHDVENLRELHGMHTARVRDTRYLEAAGNDIIRNAVAYWKTTAEWDDINRYCKDIMSQDASRYGNITIKAWNHEVLSLLHKIEATGISFVDEEVDKIHAAAVLEGIKMMIGCLICVAAAVFVIWLNRTEQDRMLTQIRNTKKLAKAVQRFVPKNQLKLMGCRTITQVHSGMQTEIAQTMLFSDIRDFTGLSEQMSNSDLFEWLQKYVSRMTKVTGQERGYIDKFIGDAVFAVFPQPTNGVNAAIQMHVSTDQMNLELVAEGKTKLVSIGVGLHFGVIVAGVFGDKSRLQCTLVASDVNLASRLEGLCKGWGTKITASAAVVGQIDASAFRLRCLGKVQVSGSGSSIVIFDIFQCDPMTLQNHKLATLRQFEKAIRMAEKKDNAGMAAAQFAAIAKAARKLGIRDVAAEQRATHIDAAIDFGDGDGANGGGVISFEKDGTPKSASVNSSFRSVSPGNSPRDASLKSPSSAPNNTGLFSPGSSSSSPSSSTTKKKGGGNSKKKNSPVSPTATAAAAAAGGGASHSKKSSKKQGGKHSAAGGGGGNSNLGMFIASDSDEDEEEEEEDNDSVYQAMHSVQLARDKAAEKNMKNAPAGSKKKKHNNPNLSMAEQLALDNEPKLPPSLPPAGSFT